MRSSEIDLVVSNSTPRCRDALTARRIDAQLALLALAAMAAVCQGDEPLRVIKQGGYVEKVEPGVDYKDRMPRIPPRNPAESLNGMHLIPGFRLEQVAAEPLVRDPVDLAFDENGRLYVAELITYSEARATKAGRVSLLEDLDGDGQFDKSTIFADQLEWPAGLLCFDGGVFVASPPDLYYFKDNDGDGKADTREVVITGFDANNPNQCPNSLRWSLDNRVELMPSTGGGLLHAVKWASGGQDPEAATLQIRGRDLSFEPRAGEMRPESGGSQFGMTFDDWGRKFESSNSAPIEMVMYEDRYLARNPYLAAPASRIPIWVDGNEVYRTSPAEPWRIIRTEMRIRGIFSGPVEGGGRPAGYFTSACGVMIYTGDAWPKEFQGNAFVCEGAGNLVHRMRLEASDVAFTAHRTEKETEFLTSDEIWFRPVQFTHGPDGTLYLADMYRETYEHPDAIPPSAKRYLDINAGNDRGRIYRIVPDGFQQPKPVRLAALPTPQLVQLLAHSNSWHRRTASRLLYERQSREAVEPLKSLASNSPSALGRMHAMYALDGMESLTDQIVLNRLQDSSARVREHAVRLAERVLDTSPAVRAKLYEMTGDDDIRVRYQLAFTLGDIPSARSTEALADVGRRDVRNPWIRLAILSSSLARAGELFSLLASDTQWCRQSEAGNFLEQLAEQAGLQRQDDQLAEVIQWLDRHGEDQRATAQSVVRGLSQGLSKSRSPLLAKLSGPDHSRAGQLLAEMIREAMVLAADSQRPESERTPAIRSLAIAQFDEARSILDNLLDSRQPRAVQTAALQTLSRFDNAEVAGIIIDAWQGFSPNVRSEAAEALFARGERLAALLAALEQGGIAPSQLAPARIQYLLAHPDDEIRAESQRLLAGSKLARRDEAVSAYQDVLTIEGDVPRGRAVFKRECSACHKLEGVGHDLGLPLQNVKTRGPEGILLQVLDPNREVNSSYLNYTVVTNDGRLITGAITAEAATSITLSRGDGESDTVLRTDIDELVSSNLSIMPEGLEKNISKQEMADLLAYLMIVVDR